MSKNNFTFSQRILGCAAPNRDKEAANFNVLAKR